MKNKVLCFPGPLVEIQRNFLHKWLQPNPVTHFIRIIRAFIWHDFALDQFSGILPPRNADCGKFQFTELHQEQLGFVVLANGAIPKQRGNSRSLSCVWRIFHTKQYSVWSLNKRQTLSLLQSDHVVHGWHPWKASTAKTQLPAPLVTLHVEANCGWYSNFCSCDNRDYN